MLSLLLGCLAFVLYLLYDINSYLWQLKAPRSFFLIGTLLLACAAVTDIRAAWLANAFTGLKDAALLLLSAAAFAALLYSLFFALPFDETYAQQQNGRCDQILTHNFPPVLLMLPLYAISTKNAICSNDAPTRATHIQQYRRAGPWSRRKRLLLKEKSFGPMWSSAPTWCIVLSVRLREGQDAPLH